MEVAQTEVTSTAEDPTPEGGPQLALTDKPARTRPRFDPTVEHAVGRKIAERSARGRLTYQQPHQESRDPSTDGVSTREEEQERRKRPPLPPPATPKTAARTRSLTFPPPPPRADSATESATSTPRNRGIMRLRTKEVDHPPQRTMPRRTAIPIGGSTQQQPLATPQRQPQSEQQGQSRQWEDRTARWDQSGGRLGTKRLPRQK